MAMSLLLICWLAGSAQEPRVVERSFTSELELATDNFEITATEAGRSVEQEGPRLEREEAYEIEIADTLFDDQQPPAKFTRFYRTVMNSLRLSGSKTPLEKTISAGLEGQRVTFEREENGRYARSCEDDAVRKVQLNRLRADLSLAHSLPPVDEEGEQVGTASFALPISEFERILAPLEDRPRRPHKKKSAASVGGLSVAPAALTEPIAALLAGAEGELTVTLRAKTEDDEQPRNADLAFRFESSFDGSAGLLAAGAGEAHQEATDEVELVYEGTGTLAWDPESGRIELQCQGELRMSEHFTVRVEAGGKTGEARGRLALTGTLALEAREE